MKMSERVLDRLKEKCMCIQDEKERLEAAVMKSGTVEKGIASIKKHGYVSCLISNAVGN
jgi:hypothetical protein